MFWDVAVQCRSGDGAKSCHGVVEGKDSRCCMAANIRDRAPCRCEAPVRKELYSKQHQAKYLWVVVPQHGNGQQNSGGPFAGQPDGSTRPFQVVRFPDQEVIQKSTSRAAQQGQRLIKSHLAKFKAVDLKQEQRYPRRVDIIGKSTQDRLQVEATKILDRAR